MVYQKIYLLSTGKWPCGSFVMCFLSDQACPPHSFHFLTVLASPPDESLGWNLESRLPS